MRLFAPYSLQSDNSALLIAYCFREPIHYPKNYMISHQINAQLHQKFLHPKSLGVNEYVCLFRTPQGWNELKAYERIVRCFRYVECSLVPTHQKKIKKVLGCLQKKSEINLEIHLTEPIRFG